FGGEQVFRWPIGGSWAFGQAAGKGCGGVLEGVVVDQLGCQTDLEGAVGVDSLTQHQQFCGSPQPDHTRKQVGRTHVGSGEAHLGEEEVEPGGPGDDAEVGGQGDDRAGAGGHTVDGRDHRHRHLAYSLDHGTGHAGEVEEGPGIHLQQLTDDLVDVAAGAEPPASAGDDQNGDVVTVGKLTEEVPEVGIDVEREGVQPVGPVEREGGDPIGDDEVEVAPRLGEAG